MTRAMVTVELHPNDLSGERLLHALDLTLGIRCAGIAYSIVRKQEFIIPRDFDEGVDLALSGVRDASPPLRADEPKENRWGLYLCPRRLDFKLDARVTASLSTVLIAIANKGVPVGIFLQTITNEQIPDAISTTLHERMEAARNNKIRRCVPNRDIQTIELFTNAVGEAYERAFSPSCIQ